MFQPKLGIKYFQPIKKSLPTFGHRVNEIEAENENEIEKNRMKNMNIKWKSEPETKKQNNMGLRTFNKLNSKSISLIKPESILCQLLATKQNAWTKLIISCLNLDGIM